MSSKKELDSVNFFSQLKDELNEVNSHQTRLNELVTNCTKKYQDDVKALHARITKLEIKNRELKKANKELNYKLEESNSVRYGMKVKVMHVGTKKFLHSHQLKYSTGSKQQQVTCFDKADVNDFWIVYGPHGVNTPTGQPVPVNSTIRLRHLGTSHHLHSHPIMDSPKTGQQEVSCFRAGDVNDNWIIESLTPSHQLWQVGTEVRFVHVGTKSFLHSHNENFNLGNNDVQQEVTAVPKHNENTSWIAMPVNY